MSTKPQSSALSTAPAKQTRSRKTATAVDAAAAGRAGSAGGVVLEKEGSKKPASSSSTKTTKPAAAAEPKDAQPKRKPRKLNKEPSTATKDVPSTESAELEALKSRVRGLEAKVEELYKSAPQAGAAARSPRRRGKGRKTSSATTTATLGSLARDKENQASSQVVEQDDEEADEELVRLEDELEHARQDLALFHPSGNAAAGQGQQRPRTRRSTADDAEHVEEIPRDRPAAERPGVDRQVTLSGSYRIPLPATLNPEDVKTIQSGVAAAQNVARSFLDQRRANRGVQGDAGTPPGTAKLAQSQAKGKAQRAHDVGGEDGAVEGGKLGWAEWIGGYSVAISRAVKSIEHEAAMEAQRPGVAGGKSVRGGAEGGGRRKRPGVKTALSGEQIEGLMG
ncbi:hypothetical protein B5807_10565 [Epicoccum nigrum]|uniref:Uncharacterized protein n=1 Tax=Epicoccum nigrum TaxID=105696 RepID=A0A1Y2LLI7_EPING|nr:hypothetical protein B5807_10565 [Epicoccum nigrum]